MVKGGKINLTDVIKVLLDVLDGIHQLPAPPIP